MMKKNQRIPTLVALFLLILGVVMGTILLKKNTRWSTGASAEIQPKEVRITNIMDNSFTVSWITDKKSYGAIQYGLNQTLNSNLIDDRDQSSGTKSEYETHYLTVKDLKPVSDYFFKIISGGQSFDNNGQLYQAKTAQTVSTVSTSSDVAYGTILDQNNNPLEGALVYLTLPNVSPLSSLTKSSGNWLIPLNLARSSDLTGYANYDLQTTLEEVFVQAGLLGTANAVSTTKNDSPMPEIILGKSFDFRESNDDFSNLPSAKQVFADNTDLPSFTASPSATLTPTEIPIPTPTVSPPQSGNLTPTLVFFIMGIALITSGYLIKKIWLISNF